MKTVLCAKRTALSGSIESLEPRVVLATLIWDGSVNSDWFNAQNWDQNAVPGSGDTAILNIASTINLTGNASVGSFQQSNGTLTSPANVTLIVLSSLDWSGGTMAGLGLTKVASTATLTLSGTATKTLQQRTLSNDGIAIWTGTGELVFDNGATFDNGGSFIAQNDAILRNLGTGNSFINKAGATFDKNTATGTTEVQVAFSNAGIVTAASGTLQFSGSFAQSAGLTRLSGGTIGTASGLNLTGGELTGIGTITGNLNNSGAIVRPGTSGAGVLSVNGDYTQGVSAALVVQIGGLAAGSQYDQLNVTGTATLGGALSATYINAFTSTTGNVFDVVVAGTRTGSFATVNAVIPLTANYTATQAQIVNSVISYVWDGSAGDGNWFTPANWTPSGVPGTADLAILDNGQTINLPSSTPVGYFQLANGTLTSPVGVTFSILHDFVWTGGTMSGSGVTNANGGLQMNDGLLLLDARTLNLPAGQTATLSATTELRLDNGAQFNNSGTFLAQNDNGILDNVGTASLFNNIGTFVRDTTTGIFTVRVPFANSGTVNLGAGTLLLSAGGSGTITGDFNVVNGSQVDFRGTFSLGASADVSGAGRVVVSGGSVTFGGTLAIPKMTVSGGTSTVNVPVTGLDELIVSGGTANFNATAALNLSTLSLGDATTLNSAGTINVSGPMNWTYGTISGSGPLNANGGLSIDSSGNFSILDGRTLNLAAGQTTTMLENAYLQLENGARVNNAGTFLVQADSEIRDGGGAANLFNNTGTFTRDTTTGIFTVGVPFASSGTVNLAAGTLLFTGGGSGTITGDFNIVDGSRLDFRSNFNLGPGADVAGAGRVIVSGSSVTFGGTLAIAKMTVSGGTSTVNVPVTGLDELIVSGGTANFNATAALNVSTLSLNDGATLSSPSTINVSGLLNWIGGTMGGSGVTNANGGLSIDSNGNFAILDGRTLNLAAGQTTTMLENAYLQLENAARVNSAGTFLVQADSEIRDGGGAASLFNNTGTFTRDTTTGIFTVGVSFANSGTINAVTNAPVFNGGFTQSATGSIIGGKQVTFSGGTVSAGGTMVANVSNTGATFSPGESGVGALSITGNFTQTGGTLTFDLAGTSDGSFDKLTVSGTANLAGAINVIVLPGFTPPGGATFEVLTNAAQNGTFGSQTGAAGFNLMYQGNKLVLVKASATYTWDAGGGVDTNWFTPANWSPTGVPTASDNAILDTLATIDLSGNASVLSFTQSNGILIGTGNLTATTFTWTGGTQGGTGMTTIPAGGTFTLQGGESLTQRTIDLEGSGVWTGTGALQLANGATFNISNGGIFDIKNDAPLNGDSGGALPHIVNSGTLTKTGGTSTTFNSIALENSGILDIHTGTLAIAGTGATFTQTAGETKLTGGTFNSTATLTFNGGILGGNGTIGANIANANATIQPGGMGAVGTLNINGAYTQLAGGNLAVELASASSFDQFLITGAATLAGGLSVSSLGGFMPQAQDFRIMGFASRTGTLTGPPQFALKQLLTEISIAPILPDLQIDDVSVVEGASGTTLAVFTVNLSYASLQTVTVQYSTANGTAIAPGDFTAAALTTLTFAPGETTKTISIAISGDNSAEISETFTVVLSGVNNATIGKAIGTGMIINDDPGLSVGDVAALEGTNTDPTQYTVFTFPITLSNAIGSTVTVHFKTLPSPLAGLQFLAETDQVIVFNPGDTMKFATVNVIPDNVPQGAELFQVEISNENSIEFIKQQATGTIYNDDLQVIDDHTVSFKEADGDTVTISVPGGALSAQDITVAPDGSIGTVDLTRLAGLAHAGGREKPANLTISVTQEGNGNGMTQVGTLNASGVNLGKVKLMGDLGRFLAGNLGNGKKTAVKSVTLAGALGIASPSLGGLESGAVEGGPVTDKSLSKIFGSLGKVVVGGNVNGASLEATEKVANISIQGAVLGGQIAAAEIGAIKVRGAVQGNAADDPAMFVAQNKLGKLVIDGDVTNGLILVGYNKDGIPRNPDAKLGKLVVKGNWIASSLAVGVVDATKDGFGRNDTPIQPDTTPAISKIASIVIQGTVSGSANPDDSFAFTAQKIGKLSINQQRFPLSPRIPDNFVLDPVNQDLSLVELGS